MQGGNPMLIETEIVIIGAGVVGLAIAAELAERGRQVFVFERNQTFGQETSSRNSEVIHAGIYYPGNSLKAELCIEGRNRLYEICTRNHIPHRKTGKLILAVDDAEIPALERLFNQGISNGVSDLRMISSRDISRIEPNITGKAAILSPSTGIVDVHALMQFFCRKSIDCGADILFQSEVAGIEPTGNRWRITVSDWEGISEVFSEIVINSAGLQSQNVALLAGIERADYRIHFCKGEYFGINPRWRGSIERLVYPVPEQSGLGIHATISLDRMLKLGPNTCYVDQIDYQVDPSHATEFLQHARRFLPFLEPGDISPDFAGVRPRLQGPGQPFRDFIIDHKGQTSYRGLINLIGIESPGLTAAPAIGRYVADIITRDLS